jgi:radical SAM superfamily enzyme YgiQ (UPF0313 family)
VSKRVLIIQPSHYPSKKSNRIYKASMRTVVPLVLPYLAALTPEDWDVKLCDERVEDVDFNYQPDVVAITCWRLHSIRAYDIAKVYRDRGIPVIMGGPHVYFNPDEAAQHCDAIGIGEGETIFAQMLEDAINGRLQKVYRPKPLADLSGLPLPRYDMMDLTKYSMFKAYSLMASRGCPFSCDFCSERLYLGAAYRTRPVKDIIEEIKHCDTKNVLFVDSDFGGRRQHSLELMEALIPLKIRWSALWTSYLCYDQEFMDMAKKSGLLHVNLGIESINPDTVKDMNKKFNKVARYDEMVDNLRRRGISFSLNFIFGWDTDNKNVFRHTLDFLNRNKVPVAYFNILTPDMGTEFFERMRASDRILNINDIGRWPGQNCFIKPKWCTPEELEEGVHGMYKEFYSLKSMFERLPIPVTKSNLASWFVNFSQRRMARSPELDSNFDVF